MTHQFENTNAPGRQVGGEHYAGNFQHWDWVEVTGIGYLEGQISRYVYRWYKKDGQQGLGKALHCTEKLVELYNTIGRRNRAVFRDPSLTDKLCQETGVPPREQTILQACVDWETEDDLYRIRIMIEDLIQINDSYPEMREGEEPDEN